MELCQQSFSKSWKKNYLMIIRMESIKKKWIWPQTLNKKIRGTSHKYLGITLDKTLKFDVHINKVCIKVSHINGLTRRISNMVPDSALQSLYYGFYNQDNRYAFFPRGLLFMLSSNASKTVSILKVPLNRPGCILWKQGGL